MELLPQILTSWQVILVTVVLILYIKLVSLAAKGYRRPRLIKKLKSKIKKTKPKPAAEGPEETKESVDSNEELGLEEK